MGFHYLDLIVLALVVILGLKGLLRGVIKEAFSAIGIIAGVWLGSRFALQAGEWASAHFESVQSEGVSRLAGFAIVFLAVWLLMLLLGSLAASASRRKESSARFDMAGGAVVGAVKIFLIFSVIAYAFGSTDRVREWANENLQDSFMYPVLYTTGSWLIKLDIEESARGALDETKARASEGVGQMSERLIAPGIEAAGNLANGTTQRSERE